MWDKEKEGEKTVKHPFTNLTKKDVEKLRRKRSITNGKGVIYNFTIYDVMAAQQHLESLYSGKVTLAFTERILLLNEIY